MQKETTHGCSIGLLFLYFPAKTAITRRSLSASALVATVYMKRLLQVSFGKILSLHEQKMAQTERRQSALNKGRRRENLLNVLNQKLDAWHVCDNRLL